MKISLPFAANWVTMNAAAHLLDVLYRSRLALPHWRRDAFQIVPFVKKTS